jgi:hypothetical protein
MRSEGSHREGAQANRSGSIDQTRMTDRILPQDSTTPAAGSSQWNKRGVHWRPEVMVGLLQRFDGTPMRDGVAEADTETMAAYGAVLVPRRSIRAFTY